MVANNEFSAELDGKRAAVDLATATRPDDFTHKCYDIDSKLSHGNPEYQRTFMNAMNNELQDRNLLPKIELNMVAAGDTPAMQALQNNKHVETQDILRDEDQLRDQGRNTEAMLMHRLGSSAQVIHDTHAERNFWGKNHGGINMDRINRWADENKADMRGAFGDIQDTRAKPIANNDRKDCPPEHDKKVEKIDPRATDYDRKQDERINRIEQVQTQEKKAHEEAEKASQLKAKIEAGVIKDAHHTVKHGETLYDMACLALHKAGRDHQTPAAIKFEEEKIRALNHLAPHEPLHSGQSLMLRTPQEVEHETARRIKLNEKVAKSSDSSENSMGTDDYEPVRRQIPWGHRYRHNNNQSSENSHEGWHAPPPGYINSYNRGY
ncbi:hypothetical protein BH10CYA1_BH10CYA1_20680 [soil metagenome]